MTVPILQGQQDEHLTQQEFASCTRKLSPRAMDARRSRGFTLVELIIVMIVTALLAAVAMASYRSYTLQARRASAITALSDAATRQEQFFLNNRSYTATLGAGGLNVPAATPGDAYLVSIDAPTAGCPIARCWSMRATPQDSQAKDACGTLTHNSDGDRAPADCW